MLAGRDDLSEGQADRVGRACDGRPGSHCGRESLGGEPRLQRSFLTQVEPEIAAFLADSLEATREVCARPHRVGGP